MLIILVEKNLDLIKFYRTASDAGWINGHTYALFGPPQLDVAPILEYPAAAFFKT